MAAEKIEPEINQIWAMLAGPVNEAMVQRVFNTFTVAINQKVERIHLLIQSTGGMIGDGIAIHNFMRNLPLEIITYNMGWNQSIAVPMFLGAKKRKASKTASFMIHRAHFSSGIPASSGQLQGIADSLTVHDANIESILKSYINMPEDKWAIHRQADLYLTSAQAIEYGLIDEVADFAPPLGGMMVNIIQ